MESLNRKDIDCHLEDFCTNKRMRGISEINSSGSESSNRRMIGKSDGELEKNDKGDRGRSLIKCDSFGWISVIGRQRTMEDAVAVAELDSYRFFAVYDGHGGSGVANACRDRLHQLLEEEVEGRANGSGGGAAVEWEKVMRECFRKMDEEIVGGRGLDDQVEDGDGGGGRGREVALNTVGSTALVLIVGKAVVVVANCGDSRAVLCRDGGTVPLSRAYKVTCLFLFFFLLLLFLFLFFFQVIIRISLIFIHVFT